MLPHRSSQIRPLASSSRRWQHLFGQLRFLMLSMMLNGCFYAQVTTGQLSLVNGQIRLPNAIDKESNPERKLMLRWVPAILAFARDVMLMDSGASYRGYVAINGPGMTYVLSAAQKTRLEPYRWWFPFAGSVEYKSFFAEAEAEEAANALAADGYDTYIGPSRAYSTLGYLRDPVSSTMMSDGFSKFVEVLLHEIAHRKLYVPGKTEFNEQLASFVALQGQRRFFSQTQFAGTHLPQELERRAAAEREFLALVQDTAQELELLYGSELSEEKKLEARKPLFAQLQAAWPGRAPSPEFNNALLLQYLRYGKEAPVLQRIWTRCRSSFRCFWSEVEALDHGTL